MDGHGARPLGHSVKVGLIIGLAGMGLFASASSAQPDPGERSNRLLELFSRMAPNTGVRVTTPVLFIAEGTFRELGEDLVVIGYQGEVVPVYLDEIRTLQVEGRHPIQGTLWGLGAGILVGSVAGMMVASFDCRTPTGCQNSERAGAIRWGTVFGTAGAIGGFVIGRYTISWKRIFP
ncbi:MAG: hypothetical protein OEN56_15120 [Gemmatimonadota bacterium]|nr:hypothetical protein [Gemmatimonadota bacterium]